MSNTDFSAAAVTEMGGDLLEGTTSMLSNTADGFLADLSALFTHDLMQWSVLYQFAAIAVATLLALMVSRRMNARLGVFNAGLDATRLSRRALHFAVALVQSMSFSVTVGVLLSLAVIALQTFGLVLEGEKLILVRLAYSLFYAWAFLLMLLAVLTEVLGQHRMGRHTRNTVIAFFWILVVLQIVGVLPVAVAVMKTITLPIGDGQVTLWSSFVGLITVFITLSLANWLSNISEEAIMSAKDLDSNLRIVFARLTRIAFSILAILMALAAVGIDLTVLSVLGGVVGVGLGFGLQKIAANYVSGFIILFDRSVKLGDLVDVGGASGVITQINTRYSVIRNLAGEEFIVPNEKFISNTVQNFSLTDRGCIVTADLLINYETDAEKALDIILAVVKAQPRVSMARQPWAIVAECSDSTILLRTGFWVEDPEKGTGGLRSQIIKESLRRFGEAGFDLPYNRSEVELTGRLELANSSKEAV